MATTPKLLTASQLKKSLKGLDGWTLPAKGTSLQKTFTFDGHVEALVFIARITVHAQVLNHHPEILFTFRKVRVTLTTHDVKGLSSLDIDLAKRIQQLQLQKKSG
jgi:4a-hydroxytetrahydrobiopterin dehydratase